MHEIVICKNIVEQLKNYNNIKSITLEVGDLAHLTSNELLDTMKKLVNYNINVIEKNAIIKCSCGFEGKPNIVTRLHDIVIFECPKCNNVPKILEGNKIIIKEIKLH